MKKIFRLTLTLITVQLSFAAVTAEFPETIQQVKSSIVGVGTIQKMRTPPAQLLGTGFIVGTGLQVITNAHVLSKMLDTGQHEQWVVFVGHGSNPEIRTAELRVSDSVHDLALLHITGKPLPALMLADSDKVQEGEHYAFTGFPIGSVLGLYPSTHRAMISTIVPIVIPANQSVQLNSQIISQLRSPFNIFQLDATAYPGNSGSPLYQMASGAVVGILNMVFVKESKENVLSNPSGISYAIPSNFIKTLLTQPN